MYVIKNYIIILVTAFLLLASNSKSSAQALKDSLKNNALIYKGLYNVSLIKLIGYPDKYNGKRVRVIGYLNVEFEGNALYLHKEDYDNHISENAIRADFTSEQFLSKAIKALSRKYCLLEATYNSNNNDLVGFSGTLTNITRLESWYQPTAK